VPFWQRWISFAVSPAVGRRSCRCRSMRTASPMLPKLAFTLAAVFAAIPGTPSALARDVVVSAGATNTSTHDYVTGTVFVDGHGERRQAGRFTWQPMLSAGWIDGRDREGLEDDAFVLA